jgi:hypothetical protein
MLEDGLIAMSIRFCRGMTLEMRTSVDMLERRLREGAAFAHFLRKREGAA